MEYPTKKAFQAVQIVCRLMITIGPFMQHVQGDLDVRVKKPVYSIVHMVNSIDKLDDAMDLGANAVQLDVEFQRDGSAIEVHYGPCNCLPPDCKRRDSFVRMLNYIRDSTHTHEAYYGRQPCLVVLHLKLEPIEPDLKYKAGAYVAEQLVKHLWKDVAEWNGMNVLMSVKTAEDIDVIRGANDTVNKLKPIMKHKMGYDARDEQDLEKVRDMYQQLGRPGHFWQGAGKSTCELVETDADRLQTILDERDSEWEDRYAQKVYHWVIDIPFAMQRSLVRGVDAIITNRPGRLRKVLKKAMNRTHRLATIVDNPWKWFDGWTPFLRKPTAGIDKLGDDNLIIVPGVND